MTANETRSQTTSPLYDALPITNWSLPSDLNRQGQNYDVVALPAVSPILPDSAPDHEGRRSSQCERLWSCSRRNRVRMNRSISPAAPLTSTRPRSWHMARHGSILVVSSFDGIECIQFSASDGRFMQRSHHLFDAIRMGKTFDSPCFLDISEDGQLVAFAFDGQLHVYDFSDPFGSDTLRRRLVLPINGTIVAVQFLYNVPGLDRFVCIFTAEALCFVVNVRKAKTVSESYSPRRSITDSLMFNFSSFGTEQSLQYALECISGGVRIGHDRFVIAGPRSDPLPDEKSTPKDPVQVSDRMTFMTVQIHVDHNGRIDIKTLDVTNSDDNFIPSRRLAQLLGQARSILSHASPSSVFDVTVIRSPKAKLVATLDVYGHVSLWEANSARVLGSVHLPSRPMDISFWSDTELAVAYESGSIQIWKVEISGDGLNLIESAMLPPSGESTPSTVNMSSIGDQLDSHSGLFVLESTVEYLQARRSWPEAQTIGPSENIIEHTTFKLLYLQTVAADEALSRLLFRNEFDAAMQICSDRSLCADPVYKRRWTLADPIDTPAIDEYLMPVKTDLYWKLEQCRLRCADDIDAQRHLLQVALSLTDSASKDLDSKDDILWAYRLVFFYYLDLLETFILVQPYDMDKYSSFRRTSLLETAMANARSERVSTLQVLLYRHHTLLSPHIYHILDCIPETTSISMYGFLIPTLTSSSPLQRSKSSRPADWVELDSRYLDRALACDSVRQCVDLQPWVQCMTDRPAQPPISPVVWFRTRALQIDSISGHLSNALELLRTGVEAFPEDTELAVLKSSAELLSRLLYEWDLDHVDPSLSLQTFHDADPASKIHFLLRNVPLDEMSSAISERVPSDLRGQPLSRYIVDQLSPRSLDVIVSLIRSEISEARQVAGECVARCTAEPGDLESLRFLADFDGDPETGRWVSSAAISARRHLPRSPSFFAGPDALDRTLDFVNKLILDEIRASTVSSGTASRRYSALLDDLYTIVGPRHISGCQELFLAAILGSGQIDIGRQFSNLIPHERFQEIALMEARHQFNLGSENVDVDSDPHMLTARAILALCDHSEEVSIERSLLHAWSFIYKIGMRCLKPIELRSQLYRDHLLQRFIQHCVLHHEKAIQSNWIQEFARILRLDSVATSRLLMQCAIEASKMSPNLGSFSQHMATLAMASHSYVDGWAGCMEIGGQDMYCHAIWSCPPDQLLRCVHAAIDADQRNDTEQRLESIRVLNVVNSILHKKPPSAIPSNVIDMAVNLMADSYISAMACLWSLPRSQATALLEKSIATVNDADFALRFVATAILSDRGADVRDLLWTPLETLLSELSEERSIVDLQHRRHKIERTSRLLHGVDIDVDLESFLSNSEYAIDTLSRLVHSVSIGDIDAAISLAAEYDYDPGQLFAQHLSFLFRTVQDASVLEQHMIQLSATCMKSLSGSWFGPAMSMADGSNFSHLLLLYQLRCRQSDLTPAAQSRLQKHISILERLQSGQISLDYKVVLGGGPDAYRSIRSAVNDRTVAILTRLASRIRDLQENDSVPALTESTILIDYLVEVLLARPPAPAAFQSFVDLYGQYLARLSLEHFAEILRKVSHSQPAVDFVSRYISENVEVDQQEPT